MNSTQLNRFLDAKPAKHTAFVYQAIVLSLAAHVFILAFIYLTNRPHLNGNQTKEENQIEELNLAFEPEEEIIPEEQMPSNMSEEVRNLLANNESAKTRERVSYTRKSNEEIEEEVMNDLRNLEASEYAKLKEGHEEIPAEEKKQQVKTDDKKKKENYDWVNKPSDKSYEGHVAASFTLAGRDPITSPKPLYRCKSSGRVVVKIEVANTGEVLSAIVDESQSVESDCLREESQKYAMKWKFNYKTEAPKKQNGTITFDFSAQ